MTWTHWLFALIWSAVLLITIPVHLAWKSPWNYIGYSGWYIGFLAFFLLVTKHRSRDRAALRKNLHPKKRGVLFFIAATSCLVAWSFYWYLFYPGLISWDIYVQWHEMAGKIPFSDWHPLFHTLLVWLITRLWYSPGVIVLVQGISCALLVGMVTLKLERLRVQWWIIILVALFYALFPLIGFLNVTPIKDTAFSIACLWLTLLTAEIVLTRGNALTQKKNLVSLVVALLCVALLRHNGIVPAFGTCIVLLSLYRRYFKQLFLCAIVLCMMIAVYKGPVFQRLEVNTRDTNVLKAHLPIMHIGAVLAHNGKVTDEERQFLNRVMPISYWKTAYSPYSCMSLIFGKDEKGHNCLNGNFLKDKKNYNAFFAIWSNISLRNLKIILLDYYTSATELVWRISANYPIFVFPNEDLVEEHLYSGYKPSVPLVERVNPLAQSLILRVTDPTTGWLFHRGALFVILMSFFVTNSLVCTRDYRILIIALPIYLQIATLIAFPLVQDSRFVYPVILVAPFIIALCATDKVRYPDTAAL